jgi:hypothetical protein
VIDQKNCTGSSALLGDVIEYATAHPTVGPAPADLMMSESPAQAPLINRTNARMQPLSLLTDLSLTASAPRAGAVAPGGVRSSLLPSKQDYVRPRGSRITEAPRPAYLET